MEEGKDILEINVQKIEVKGRLTLIKFKKDGFWIAYIPSLNISAYGEDIQEAMTMLRESMDDFSTALFESGKEASMKELSELGWKQDCDLSGKFSNSINLKNILMNKFQLSSDANIIIGKLEF